VPFGDTALAVRGGLDFLEVLGHERFVLIGQSYGAIVVANYLANERDTLMDNGGEKRVKAVVLLNPLTELRQYPRADLLQRYEERVSQAEASVAAGRGGIPQLEPGRNVDQIYDPWLLAGPFIAPAKNFLDYWSPASAARNLTLLQKLAVPTLVLASGHDSSISLETLRGLKSASTIEIMPYPDADAQFAGRHDAVSQDISGWLMAQKLNVPPRVLTHVVDVSTGGGRVLQGVAYLPEQGLDRNRPAMLLVGGRTADTVQSSTHWMGLRLAAKGLAVFAPGMRVSGVAGFQESTHAEAAEDIGRWIDRLNEVGFKRVVLTGHSNGGIWISNYMSLTQDPRVVGLVYFAPTRDTVTFAQKEEGEQYGQNIRIARDAVARGDGLRQVIGLMTAQAWLDNNGPDSRGMHTLRVREFDRPGLSVTGAKDPLMSPDFVVDFRQSYRGKLREIRYPEGSHGLRESKPQLGDDVAAWVSATFP
jgi:pimeloyl-ACP methyl ester carboxylesterase